MIESGIRTIRSLQAAALCLMLVALSGATGFAQAPPTRQLAPADAPSPSAPPAQQSPSPPAAPEQKSGLFDTFGRWIDQSVDAMNKGLKSTIDASQDLLDSKKAAETASEVAKGAAEAAGAVGRLGTSRVVKGQALCAIAPNGAPDCRVAAESMCKAAGFATGSSVDYVTSEKCPTQTYIAGRQPAPGECTTEHTVTRALCQ
jgi:hypothetical protein